MDMMIKGNMNRIATNNDGYDTQGKDEQNNSKQQWI